MKTIQVTDETYDFLMELSKELNTQDNRCTASPYFYQVQDEEEYAAGEDHGEEAWHYDSTVIKTDEEIKEAIFEAKDWDLESVADLEEYATLDRYDKEEILKVSGFYKVYIGKRKVLENAFLTEKACKSHIASNQHHYIKPVDYLSYASRNPELEKILNFLKSLTK